MEISMEIFLTAISVIFSLLIVCVLVVIGKRMSRSYRQHTCAVFTLRIHVNYNDASFSLKEFFPSSKENRK